MTAVAFADNRSVIAPEVPDAALEEAIPFCLVASCCPAGLGPSAVITRHGGLDKAPRPLAAFDKRVDGVITAVRRP
jgi:hypothetical protein